MSNDLRSMAQVLESLLQSDQWQPQQVRAVLRAGRALARENGCPGAFDRLIFQRPPVPPSVA